MIWETSIRMAGSTGAVMGGFGGQTSECRGLRDGKGAVNGRFRDADARKRVPPHWIEKWVPLCGKFFETGFHCVEKPAKHGSIVWKEKHGGRLERRGESGKRKVAGDNGKNGMPARGGRKGVECGWERCRKGGS